MEVGPLETKDIFGDQYLYYCAEQWGRKLIQESYGFVMYDIGEDNIYIADMFILPDSRGKGYGAKLEDKVIEIAKKAGIKSLTCAIHRSDKDWQKNLKIYTRHRGYRLLEKDDHRISLIKEIGSQL
jgi:GNAT superfamily N-acetyltransferase